MSSAFLSAAATAQTRASFSVSVIQVKLVPRENRGNGVRQQVANRKALGNAISDICGGHIDMAADDRESLERLQVATGDDDEGCHFSERVDFPPCVEARDIVISDKIKKFGLGKTLPHEPDSIDSEGWPLSLRLAGIHREPGLAGDSGRDHFAAKTGRHRRAGELVGRHIHRNKNDTIQAEGLHGIPRQNEVPVVDGIEAPAKQTDFF
jgi:hypothetical protein